MLAGLGLLIVIAGALSFTALGAGVLIVGNGDSGHTGIISITIRVRRTSRNVMKPRIQCVLTH
jgi:hypothetical protein